MPDTIAFKLNDKPVRLKRGRRTPAALGAADRPGADRHQVRLRRRALRRLHGAGRRDAASAPACSRSRISKARRW